MEPAANYNPGQGMLYFLHFLTLLLGGALTIILTYEHDLRMFE